MHQCKDYYFILSMITVLKFNHVEILQIHTSLIDSSIGFATYKLYSTMFKEVSVNLHHVYFKNMVHYRLFSYCIDYRDLAG